MTSWDSEIDITPSQWARGGKGNMKTVQKVVRTACPQKDYWHDGERLKYLTEALNDGYRVLMCNTIQRSDGEQWLEYILEKEISDETD